MQINDEMVEKAASRVSSLMEGKFGEALYRDDAIDIARAALEAALAAMWKPISEAPRDGSLILAYNESHDEQVVVGWTAEPKLPEIFPDGCWTDAGSRNKALNYSVNENYFQFWQPLLSPPSTNKEDGK